MIDRNMTKQYLEDDAVGQVYHSGRLRINREQIIAFATQFDPQPYHLDENVARKSVFRGLAASGWHTAALGMRLLVGGEFRPADGVLGVGFDELSWPRPVRPGDELRVESEVLEVRPSKSRNDRGLIRVRTTTFNQHGEPVRYLPAICLSLAGWPIPIGKTSNTQARV
jgi:acyl dehydratase